MLENGSQYKNKKELDRILELNAISTAFDVNEKKISVGATCLSENCATALEIMNEQLFRPNLTQNDFDEAIKAEKDYLNSIQKDATETLLDKLYPGFFPTKEQRLQTIDNLTLDDVKEFYQELLKNASSSFVASAPFKNNPNIANLIIAYQNMPNIKFKQNVTQLEPIFFANDKPRVIYDTDDLNQAQICQSYKFPISGNIYDEVKFEMVHSILGATPNARLFQDLREKQNLAYSVSSGIQQFENTGILTLNIQTTTDDKQENVQSFDNVQKSLEGFKKHIELLQNEYVSDEELQSAKNRLKQNLLEDFQDVLYKTNLLVQNSLEPYGIKRIDKYLEAIDKITKQDIMDAAKYIFSYNPIISVLASPDTIKSQMPYLKTLGEVQNV